MKKVCVLFGSPREKGNTAHLLKPFAEELKSSGCEVTSVNLYQKDIHPCMGCRTCQQGWNNVGCIVNDDMQEIFKLIMEADMLVIATPIYSWYCTAPVKAALDRLVYGMNKYYGEKRGPSLWAGKSMALICTCGYEPEKGADLFEEGMKRYCRHSELNYRGMLVERHLGYGTVFMDAKKEADAKAFASKLIIEQHHSPY